MKRRNILSALVALSFSSGFLFPAVFAHMEGEILHFSMLPAAAQAAIKDHVGNGQMGRIDKLDNGGKTLYEARYMIADKRLAVTVTPAGEVVSTEEEMKLSATPEPAQSAIRAHASNGRVLVVVKVTRNGAVQYEAIVRTKDAKFMLTVDADGKLHEVPAVTANPKRSSATPVELLAMMFQIVRSLEDQIGAKDLSMVHNESAAVDLAYSKFGQSTNSASLPATLNTSQFRACFAALRNEVSAMHTLADEGDLTNVEHQLTTIRETFNKFVAFFPEDTIAAARAAAERYMCPMHPEVTGTRTDLCTKCGMPLDQLVRVWPFSPDDRQLLQPTISMWARVAEPLSVGRPSKVDVLLLKGDGVPVANSDLIETHTQKIHLLIVDTSLEDYHHEHPRPAGYPGVYSFEFTPRKPGSYRIWADLRPSPNGIQEYVIADLPAATGGLPLTNRAVNYKTTVDGLTYELALAQPVIKVGYPVTARLRITNPDGTGFTKLEPIMATFAHLVGFNEDYRTVLHMHPKGPPITNPNERGGPELEFQIYALQPGFVRLFAQVQIGGVSKFAPFGINVVR